MRNALSRAESSDAVADRVALALALCVALVLAPSGSSSLGALTPALDTLITTQKAFLW